ncbi:MAG: hypothetical protein P9M03_10830, partial [Candidatus Theseobacter exili]|nr:hypothetical protein [Candidatus Theseobacter exili]
IQTLRPLATSRARDRSRGSNVQTIDPNRNRVFTVQTKTPNRQIDTSRNRVFTPKTIVPNKQIDTSRNQVHTLQTKAPSVDKTKTKQLWK